MPNFYERLAQAEHLLDQHLAVNDLGGGLITVNEHLIDTNQQFEMLSPDFFSGTSEQNPVIKAYQLFFQQMGVLPAKTPEIPLIRDIPLRMKTHANQLAQQKVCARFLEDTILANNLSMLFADEYQDLYQKISLCLSTQQTPIEKKLITTDAEGMPLSSGGYFVELHQINGINLWLRTPASLKPEDITTATENSLQDSTNTDLIVGALKFKLLEKDRVAFNVRGVSKIIESKNDLRNLGGGHQHFLLLDRNTQTIYAINNTIGATDEDPLSFKVQIELFLQSLGDHTQYKFEFIQGKSRQPDDESYLSQVCNISQFCHYAALLSGDRIEELHDTLPPKITTLMYLLQYAIVNQDPDLSEILNDIINKVNLQMKSDSKPLETDKELLQPLSNNPAVAPQSEPLVIPQIATKDIKEPLSQLARKTPLVNNTTNHEPELSIKPVSQQIPVTDDSGKEKLIHIIDTLIDNIKNQNNGRITNRNSDWKTKQLADIQQGLRGEQECTSEIIKLYVDEIRTVCSQKRNSLHFWATPHSVAEFEKLLNDNHLAGVTNSSKMSF